MPSGRQDSERQDHAAKTKQATRSRTPLSLPLSPCSNLSCSFQPHLSPPLSFSPSLFLTLVSLSPLLHLSSPPHCIPCPSPLTSTLDRATSQPTCYILSCNSSSSTRNPQRLHATMCSHSSKPCARACKGQLLGKKGELLTLKGELLTGIRELCGRHAEEKMPRGLFLSSRILTRSRAVINGTFWSQRTHVGQTRSQYELDHGHHWVFGGHWPKIFNISRIVSGADAGNGCRCAWFSTARHPGLPPFMAAVVPLWQMWYPLG